MSEVKTLILRAPGTNCDVETAFAFQQAGAQTQLMHVNELLRFRKRILDYQILVIPGGFSYGDDLGAGKVLANELRLKLAGDIPAFVQNGGLILGICNGFQVLAKAGILPRLELGVQRFTLAANDSGRFECRWVHLAGNPESPCVFTRGIERMYLPVAHGEGKVAAEPGVLTSKNAALYYADDKGNRTGRYPDNPNGSMDDIAGICDDTGRVFALMPHPERHIRGIQHPRWTRLGAKKYGDGFQIFLNAVDFARQTL